MLIGVPKEIKTQEHRVGMVPGGVGRLVAAGHQVRVQRGAGLGSGIGDDVFAAMGAVLVDSAADAWDVEMVVKVKEPLPSEFKFFKRDQILFTYLHLAAVPNLATALMDAGVAAIAYETIEGPKGDLPLLKPMSEIAGRMATQVGASCLQKEHGGMGVLLGGVPGTLPANVVIIGGGNVGANAARIAVGMGANVTIIDRNLKRLTELDDVYIGRVNTLYSSADTLERAVLNADLVIGAVLVAGARAPKLVTTSMIHRMKAGAVVVDVAVDQGGCIETCHPTTHEAPTYKVGEVVHYCVANMPGAVARTSTFALTNATTETTVKIAGLGMSPKLLSDRSIRLGLNTWKGACTNFAVAESLGLTGVDPRALS